MSNDGSFEQEQSFEQLVAKLRDGCQESAWKLIERYGEEILRAVRRRLPTDLRSKFDSEDFVQAAWASIFGHRSRLLQLHNPGEFVAYMAAVAGNKVKMEVRRRLKGQKYNVNREKDLNDSHLEHEMGKLDGEATPSEIAAARERWFRMMAGQPSRYRRMLQLRFQGTSMQEIADRLQVDERTVRRVLKRIFREADTLCQ